MQPERPDIRELPNFGAQYLHGQHRGPEPPTACQTCGRPMCVYETQGWRWHSRFRSDGTPNIIRHAKCSAPLLLRFFSLDGHDHAIQDENGDWPWIG